MNIAVVGTGYVGLVTGTCFAHMGNTVTCVDVNQEKIDNLRQGIIPIYEPGLENLVVENYQRGTLRFTTRLNEALTGAEVAFIAVGTPMGEDGSADLQYVLAVARQIGEEMTGDIVVVDKSTVPVGTADKVRAELERALKTRGASFKATVVSNPEFLKEGAAVDDFLKPDRVVIGAESDAAFAVMRNLYKPFVMNHDRLIEMDIRSAEMTKYAANAMLATKISFINEMANICDRVGADINKVRIGIGSDKRIGYSFIYPGAGYGGSCFPKDVRALEKVATDSGYTPKILQAVEAVNQAQKLVVPSKITSRYGKDLKGRTFAIWGLAFKPDTDDMREASSVTLIHYLMNAGARVRVYDPRAVHEAKAHYLAGMDIYYAPDKYDALTGADALVLITEWKEFRSPDFKLMRTLLAAPVIFDGRNQYDREMLAREGFEYFEIGYSAQVATTNQESKGL